MKIKLVLATLLAVALSSSGIGQKTYTLTDLGTLPAHTSSYAWGISSTEKVVGQSDAPGAGRAFLWEVGFMQNLGTLGGTSSVAYGVNNSGQVVGFSRNTTGLMRAFLWQSGIMQDLGTLGGSNSLATGLNSSGTVVGWAQNVSGTNRAFLWMSGTMQDLGTLGGSYSHASGVNDVGQIIGFAETSSGEQHAFLWSSGVMQDLGTLPGGNRTDAYGLNSTGTVVGLGYTPTSVRPFLWSNGTIQDLGVLPGAAYGWALSVNDGNQVVGVMEGLPGGSRAFLWEQGVMYNVETLLDSTGEGWRIWTAAAINGDGSIVGYGVDPMGRERAVLLKPLPTTQSFSSIGDTYLREGQPNKNWGTETILRVRQNGQNRSLVQFDHNALTNFVGNRTVTSAKLRVYITSNGDNWGASGRDVAVHRVTQSWTELGATWNCPDDTNTANSTPDGLQWEMNNSALWPFVSSPSSTVMHTNGLVGWIEFDVTTDVQAFIDGSATNYGWIIKKVLEGQSGAVEYSSKDGLFSPELVVTTQ